jgi:hypothetical protein
MIVSAFTLSTFSTGVVGSPENEATYEWMKQLSADWVLSPSDQQEGKATNHKLVAPLVGTDATAISFKTVGKGSTVQEDLLPGNKKQMVTMYHCNDTECSQVKATHYCAKQNQPSLVVNTSESTDRKLVFDCDMSTGLCQSNEDHVHRITHETSNDGQHLKTTYVSWKNGKYAKASTYHFDRKQ